MDDNTPLWLDSCDDYKYHSFIETNVYFDCSSPMRYSTVTEKKVIGGHYTPKILSDFVASEILNSDPAVSESKNIRVLDPAVGDGELLLSILGELSKYEYSYPRVIGFDTDPEAISLAGSRIESAFPATPVDLRVHDFLDFALGGHGIGDQLGLFDPSEPEEFDIVIANPPYVRTQVMGSANAQKLARRFGLSGRVDLYYAFILAIARVLRPGGVAGIIVSNRFLTTRSGSRVRESIIDQFDILHIWDLGDTRLFEAAVLPAVLLLRKQRSVAPSLEPKFTSIYSVKTEAAESRSKNVITALGKNGVIEVEAGNRYLVRHGRLEYEQDPKNVWRIANKTSDDWLSRVNTHAFCTFRDIGKICVGVKTSADKVFIRSDWDDLPNEERPELLRPVTTHHVARRFKPITLANAKKILYTHVVADGKRIAIDLKKYPKTARYLAKHRSILKDRKYVLEAGRNWYEIWVPQDPSAWAKPKLIFRDITEKPTFWLDLNGSVVNGDCYWLVCRDTAQQDLLWLALAVGNSSFIEAFYDHKFHNKLYAGRRRFMTQYVERFPLPNPQSPSAKRIINNVKDLFDKIPAPQCEQREQDLDQLVWQAFGFSQRNP